MPGSATAATSPPTRTLAGRDDSEGITAEVALHRNIPFLDENRRRDFWWQFGGVLGVLPVAYLCPRHSYAAGKLSWKLG